MEAGQALDALVAERVMGWTVNRPGDRHWHTLGGGLGGRQVGSNCCEDRYDYGHAFTPSQDIRSAWEVVEALAKRWLHVDVCSTPDEFPTLFHCQIRDYSPGRISGAWDAEAATAPLAICRAALAATAPHPEQHK